jgi:hypothetical protein
MYPAAADLHLAKVPGHSGASHLRRARAQAGSTTHGATRLPTVYPQTAGSVRAVDARRRVELVELPAVDVDEAHLLEVDPPRAR